MKTVCEVQVVGDELQLNSFLLALYETCPYVLDQKIRLQEDVHRAILSFTDRITQNIVDAYLFHMDLGVRGITWMYRQR